MIQEVGKDKEEIRARAMAMTTIMMIITTEAPIQEEVLAARVTKWDLDMVGVSILAMAMEVVTNTQECKIEKRVIATG